MSEEETMYCDISQVKERMLIADADNSYDDSLNSAVIEASRMVDVFLMPYEEVPLNDADAHIAAITADFSASIFKRRFMPDEAKIRGALQPDMLNEVDASGWFALGLRKIELYIKSKYTLAEEVGVTVHNPDIFISLFEKGIITGKEARNLINAVSAVAINKLENIDRTLVEDITITKTTNETVTKEDTVTSYHTKKQKSFAWVKSDPDTDDSYEEYNKEDEE